VKVEGAFGAKNLRIALQVLGKDSRVIQGGSGAAPRQRSRAAFSAQPAHSTVALPVQG
jgi:hypothetical protein